MDKTRELLLRYQGLNGFDGLCHIRVYEQPGQLLGCEVATWAPGTYTAKAVAGDGRATAQCAGRERPPRPRGDPRGNRGGRLIVLSRLEGDCSDRLSSCVLP